MVGYVKTNSFLIQRAILSENNAIHKEICRVCEKLVLVETIEVPNAEEALRTVPAGRLISSESMRRSTTQHISARSAATAVEMMLEESVVRVFLAGHLFSEVIGGMAR